MYSALATHEDEATAASLAMQDQQLQMQDGGAYYFGLDSEHPQEDDFEGALMRQLAAAGATDLGSDPYAAAAAASTSKKAKAAPGSSSSSRSGPSLLDRVAYHLLAPPYLSGNITIAFSSAVFLISATCGLQFCGKFVAA